MSASPHILVLNGPNLNMLGVREPEVYGTTTLAQIVEKCEEYAGDIGITIDFQQSNIEGELITLIQQARGMADGIIINAGAYTHTSIAILDALKLTDLPVIEVHLSNVYRREAFRQTSYISYVAKGVVSGFGAYSYIMALDAMKNFLDGN